MLGLWLENKKIKLENNLSVPIPEKDEALIKVDMAGICNTDLELIKGYYPFNGILGHEFVGTVVKGPSDFINNRVTAKINIACGQCLNCQRELEEHCQSRKVLGIFGKNGAFADYLTMPIRNLYLIPDEIETYQATFIEPLAAALEIQQQINILPHHKVLVLGDGKLGNLITQTLQLTQCELWLVGRHPEKYLPFAEKGVTVGNEEIIKPQYFDIVIEATGKADGFKAAVSALRPRGTLVLKSTYSGTININMAPIVVNEITIIGSRCGPFSLAIELLSKKKIDINPLIDEVYPLLDAIEAFSHAAKPGAKKILLKPGGN